jgi:hypothetical protein
MKKKILYLVCLVFLTWSVNSCDSLSKNCKNCKKVYYSGTTYDHADSPTQYCGAELVTIQATGSVTIGAYTVKWECSK